MGFEDKNENTADDLRGKAKEAVGKVDQAKADLKKAAENVKDSFRH